MKNYIKMTEIRGNGATLGYHVQKILDIKPFRKGSVVSFVYSDGVAKRLAVKEAPEAIWQQAEQTA